MLQRLLDGGRTAADLAASAQVHPTVVRRHMAGLIGEGLVTSRAERGSRGRPKLVYALTPSGRESLFAGYQVLLSCLTRAVDHRIGARGTRAMFREAALGLARELDGNSSADSSVRNLAEVGFQPHLESGGGRRLLVSRNCPVLRMAQRSPALLCENFHTALIDGMFPGSRAELRQTMARGAPECVHVLAPA